MKDKLFFKLIGWHFIITFFSILILSLILEKNVGSKMIYFSAFLFTLLLYGLNGYFLTETKHRWFSYSGIACIGIVLWIISYILSPDTTHYKQVGSAGFWFLHELYIIGTSPLHLIPLNDYSLKMDLFQKFISPILFSASQLIGGLIKMKKIVRHGLQPNL